VSERHRCARVAFETAHAGCPKVLMVEASPCLSLHTPMTNVCSLGQLCSHSLRIPVACALPFNRCAALALRLAMKELGTVRY
jgi:hypothetical protein